MIVYDGTKTEFLNSVENDTIAIEIEKTILEKMGRHTAKNEFRSWENSLNFMYRIINDPEIPSSVGVAIEYNIPQTSKRVDFMISGYDNNGKPGIVIVELKQWESLTAINSVDGLVETYTGGANRKVVHPSYQAWSYAQLINDYNSSVQDYSVTIAPCAYLHNYLRKDNCDPLDSEVYSEYLEDAPAFTKGQGAMLRSFIKKLVKTGDNADTIYKVDHGRIRPSKSLQDSITSMLKGNPEFIMIDEQKVVYEEIIRQSELSHHDGHKRTIICQGGPGTGKSVIAVNLLAELTRRNQNVQYVSKNSAPRQVYQAKLKGNFKKSSVGNMFKGSGTYTDAPKNACDTLIVDEAHRLNEKSGMFKNLGENQVKEIIHSSLCSVFFIDENQRVTMDDIGSVAEIEKWADRECSLVTKLELQSQFRCNGSDGFLAWIDNVLDIRPTANFTMADVDYEIKICDTPNEVRSLVLEKNSVSNKSRILAGYCWKWIKEGQNDTNTHDIVIGDFAMSWNLGSGEPFAIGETSVNEIGCIHTSQGLEFDYVGVIIGDDLRYENGHIVTDFKKRASTDQSIKGIKSLYKKNPQEALSKSEEIIKNTYRTLMTRGMKGCYIYCTDDGLRDYLKKMIG